MEAFFNELSLIPISVNKQSAVEKIIVLLKTFKVLKDHDFNILRTHSDFYAEEISTGYTFADFINDPEVKGDIKLLLRSIIKNPFIGDVESYEAEAYITNTYTTLDITGDIAYPEGAAAAYIYSSPTISLSGHPHWESDYLQITIINSSGYSSSESVLNFHDVVSTNSEAFNNWLQILSPEKPLNSAKNIAIIFPVGQYTFENRAINDIISWYYDDKRYLNRVKELINDISQNPFTGGKGHTEALKGNNSGKASKRIIKKDRIIYTYTQQNITIHQCRGHYDDH